MMKSLGRVHQGGTFLRQLLPLVVKVEHQQ
jgi:hypothetical protein